MFALVQYAYFGRQGPGLGPRDDEPGLPAGPAAARDAPGSAAACSHRLHYYWQPIVNVKMTKFPALFINV